MERNDPNPKWYQPPDPRRDGQHPHTIGRWYVVGVVDAMDILYSGAIEHFCLVTSDSDYNPAGAAAAVCRVPGAGHWQTDDTSRLENGLYGVCFD